MDYNRKPPKVRKVDEEHMSEFRRIYIIRDGCSVLLNRTTIPDCKLSALECRTIWGNKPHFDDNDAENIVEGLKRYADVYNLRGSIYDVKIDWEKVCRLASVPGKLHIVVRQWYCGNYLNPHTMTSNQKIYFESKEQEDNAIKSIIANDIENGSDKHLFSVLYWEDLADLISEPNFKKLAKYCMTISNISATKMPGGLPQGNHKKCFDFRAKLEVQRDRLIFPKLEMILSEEHRAKPHLVVEKNPPKPECLTSQQIENLLNDLSDKEERVQETDNKFNSFSYDQFDDEQSIMREPGYNYSLMHTSRKLTDDEWEEVFYAISRRFLIKSIFDKDVWYNILKIAKIKTTLALESVILDFFAFAVPNIDRILPRYYNRENLKLNLKTGDRYFAILCFHTFREHENTKAVFKLWDTNMLSKTYSVLKWTLKFTEKLLYEDHSYFCVTKDLFELKRDIFLKYAFESYLPLELGTEGQRMSLEPEYAECRDLSKKLGAEYEVLLEVEYLNML